MLLLCAASCGLEEPQVDELFDPEQRQDCADRINASVQAEAHEIRFCSLVQGCQQVQFDIAFSRHPLLEPARTVTVVSADRGNFFWSHLERASDEGFYDLYVVNVAVEPDETDPGRPTNGHYTASAKRIRFSASLIANELARAWALLGATLTQRDQRLDWLHSDSLLSVEIVSDLERRYYDSRSARIAVVDLTLRWSLADFVNTLQSATTKDEVELPIDDPTLSDRLLRWLGNEVDAIQRDPLLGRPGRVLASRLGMELPDHGPLPGMYVMRGMMISRVWTEPAKPLCD